MTTTIVNEPQDPNEALFMGGGGDGGRERKGVSVNTPKAPQCPQEEIKRN